MAHRDFMPVIMRWNGVASS